MAWRTSRCVQRTAELVVWKVSPHLTGKITSAKKKRRATKSKHEHKVGRSLAASAIPPPVISPPRPHPARRHTPGSPPRYTGDDRWARPLQEDRADQGRTSVAYQHEHVRSPPDTGRGLRSAPNASGSSAAAELIHVLIPKTITPRLPASTPGACEYFVRK